MCRKELERRQVEPSHADRTNDILRSHYRALLDHNRDLHGKQSPECARSLYWLTGVSLEPITTQKPTSNAIMDKNRWVRTNDFTQFTAGGRAVFDALLNWRNNDALCLIQRGDTYIFCHMDDAQEIEASLIQPPALAPAPPLASLLGDPAQGLVGAFIGAQAMTNVPNQRELMKLTPDAPPKPAPEPWPGQLPVPAEKESIQAMWSAVQTLHRAFREEAKKIAAIPDLPKERYDAWSQVLERLLILRHEIACLNDESLQQYSPGPACQGCNETLTCEFAFDAYNDGGDFLCQK